MCLPDILWMSYIIYISVTKISFRAFSSKVSQHNLMTLTSNDHIIFLHKQHDTSDCKVTILKIYLEISAINFIMPPIHFSINLCHPPVWSLVTTMAWRPSQAFRQWQYIFNAKSALLFLCQKKHKPENCCFLWLTWRDGMKNNGSTGDLRCNNCDVILTGRMSTQKNIYLFAVCVFLNRNTPIGILIHLLSFSYLWIYLYCGINVNKFKKCTEVWSN